MKIFGMNIGRVAKALNPVPMTRNGWRVITEAFTGAWQRNITETHADLSCYPTLYACLAAPTQDVGKMPFLLMEKRGKVYFEVDSPAYSPVLRKPNGFQTAQQFRECWMLSKLMQGNAYILKRRDNRGVVVELYVLDPCRVQPMVSTSGAVFYQLMTDNLQSLPEGYPSDQLLVPAREIIHDRCMTMHHPLIGVPPLCAAYWPALKNLKILKSSATFFANSAQPGGILTAPAGMSDDDAKEVKAYWASEFSEDNSGKVAVIGADMKFTSFAMKGADSQLVEQMKYSDEQICQPFRIKPYKVGIGNPPAGWKSDDVNVEYHSDALSPMIEAMETLLIEGLGVSKPLEIWLDSEPLWRMDEGKMAEVQTKLVQGMVRKPDEARQKFNDPPTPGGDTLWGQHQDYPLGMLAQRTDLAPAPAPVEPDPDPALETENEEVRRLNAELWQRKALEATREALHA